MKLEKLAYFFILFLLMVALYFVLQNADSIDGVEPVDAYIVPEVEQIPKPEPTKMICEATAYTMEQGSGTGLTSTGTIPQAGRTIATDHSVLPPGTEVMIDGEGPYIVEDSGGDMRGNRIDIFMGHGQEAIDRALSFGRRTVEVEIKEVME